jgi:predicted nucleic acid-binding protein
MAPDIIILELLLPYCWNIVGLGLKEMSLSSSAIQRVEDLVMKYPKYPGRRDLFALSLAIEEEAILLTGDEALRKAAIQEGVPAHGTLWLLQNMVSGGAISEAEGHAGLSRMLTAGRRLPKKETQELLGSWDPMR